MTDALEDPFVEHSLRTSMFFPDSRLMVRGNPKAAGTSLRWWLLELHGVDVAAKTANSLWGESARYQTVWDGRIDLGFTWSDLPDDQQADALSATDVLTVRPLRHPVTRAFSAWAGKYLTLEAAYYDRLPDAFGEPPDYVDSADHITLMFEKFASTLADHVGQTDGWGAIDVHFWPQHRLLAGQQAGDSIQLRQEHMTAGLDRIRQHLRDHGVDASPMPRINENVIAYQPQFISTPAMDALSRVYAEDFEEFDYNAEAPDAGAKEPDLEWLNDVRGRNRRYAVVHRAALDGRRRTRQLSRRVKELEESLAAARRREADMMQSRSWRLTQPLRRASEKLHVAKLPDDVATPQD